MNADILAQLKPIADQIRALPDHELCLMLQLAALGKAAQASPKPFVPPTIEPLRETPKPREAGPRPRRSVPASDPQDVAIVVQLVTSAPDGVSMAKIAEVLAAAAPNPWSRSKSEAACRNGVLQSQIARVGEKKGAKLVRVDYPGAIYGAAAYD